MFVESQLQLFDVCNIITSVIRQMITLRTLIGETLANFALFHESFQNGNLRKQFLH